MTEVAGCQLVRSTPIASDTFLSPEDMQKKKKKVMSYFSVFESFRGELEIKLLSHSHSFSGRGKGIV